MELVLNVMYGISILCLFAAAVLGVGRIAAGPSQLDRSVGADLMVAVVICSVGLWAVVSDRDTEIVILLMLSMLGFTGAVSIARMITERIVYRPHTDAKQRLVDLR